MSKGTIIVTRHTALVEYLISLGLADHETKVLHHATLDDVLDRDVIGILPMWLAAAAASVTEVPVILPPELRGRQLSLSEMMPYVRAPRRYKVTDISQELRH